MVRLGAEDIVAEGAVAAIGGEAWVIEEWFEALEAALYGGSVSMCSMVCRTEIFRGVGRRSSRCLGPGRCRRTLATRRDVRYQLFGPGTCNYHMC